jgi:serralysin
MANPTTQYFGMIGDALIDGSTHGYYWQLGADRTVDFSISDGFSSEHWNNPSQMAGLFQYALATYSYYANIKFNYVGFFDTPSKANLFGSEINLSLSASYILFPSSSTWAIGKFDPRYSTYYRGEVGDIFLNVNSQANSLLTYEPGSAGWFVLIHEIGHVLGLKHPHDDGGTGRPTFSQLGELSLDIDWATVMSYRDNYNWDLRQFDPATPMILDVICLQYLYGKNMSTNAGDTTHQLSKTNFYVTIWDASGNDTVSAEGQILDWTIVLPSTALSSAVDTKVGFASPRYEFSLVSPQTLFWLAGDIENAIGGNGNDTLTGNSAANKLLGAAGNDWLDGGGGVDVAIFSTRLANYTIIKTATGYIVKDKTGADGTDILTNVEVLKFADMSVNLQIKAQAAAAPATDVTRLIELYIAFFNRIPDADGLSYWIGKKVEGQTINQIADTFYSAGVQYSSLTGFTHTMRNDDFVNVVYKNVLGRKDGADAQGLHYWSGKLIDGSASRGSLVSTILDSAHTFKGNKTFGYVADLLDNKIMVARTVAIDYGLSYNSGNDSVTNGMAIAAEVTATNTAVALTLVGVIASDMQLG